MPGDETSECAENSHSAAERQVKKCSLCKVRGSIATPWSTLELLRAWNIFMFYPETYPQSIGKLLVQILSALLLKTWTLGVNCLKLSITVFATVKY